MTGLRAITVCVDYADILAVTLPRNLHHFDEYHIVTDVDSYEAVERVVEKVDPGGKVSIWGTELFYRDGATFNKWRALEWGLDQMGRHGWLCVKDADVVWPRDVGMRVQYETIKWHPKIGPTIYQDRGHLLSPYRRMWDTWPKMGDQVTRGGVWETDAGGNVLPAEPMWDTFPRHRNVAEWAGYSQIFHADDPALGPPPWHEVDWKHAGGADSLFQRKWPAERKVRPPWEVLHLGPAGHNWMGRATTRADGTVPEGAEERLKAIYDPTTGIWARRRAVRAAGGSEADTFRPEKLGG